MLLCLLAAPPLGGTRMAVHGDKGGHPWGDAAWEHRAGCHSMVLL